MEILKHVVMDHFAQRNNWLTNLEVRVKLFYIGIGLVLNILSDDITVPLLFFVTSLILLMTIKVSFITLGLRMMMPFLFGIFILVIMGLHKGDTILFSGTLFGYELALKKEGLQIGLLLFTKVAGGVMLMLLLSFTTTITKICMAARWMKIPETLIEVLSFVYRYLFLLIEEMETMMSSQRSRLGYVTWFKTLKSFGRLGGMLIIRSITRAENAHIAMSSRGYDGGRVLTVQLPPLARKDYTLFISCGILLTFLSYLGFFL
ncbi:MAG: cobalt ECF transporter T component CbiQ [Planctomycetes bacterium]|nr:cobalt ECF transporter T component CbiQ [Planctomycetota bacterium]